MLGGTFSVTSKSMTLIINFLKFLGTRPLELPKTAPQVTEEKVENPENPWEMVVLLGKMVILLGKMVDFYSESGDVK